MALLFEAREQSQTKTNGQSAKRSDIKTSGLSQSMIAVKASYSQLQDRLATQFASLGFTSESRQERFRAVAEGVLSNSRTIKHPNFSMSCASDLHLMAELYDQHFFDGNFFRLARKHSINFRWSRRMTSNGGKTVRTIYHDSKESWRHTRYELVFSVPLLFQTFGDLRRPVRVTGMLCTNRLHALQRIMEHELIHLGELLIWENSCCSSSRFQNIASRLFGHTEHKHDLITQRERADQKFNVRVGSWVRFRFNGQQHVGIVNRITRRATVLVQDENGHKYDDGKTYRKFYVPISHLSPARVVRPTR